MVNLRRKKNWFTTSLYLEIYQDGVRSYEFLGIRLGKDRERNKQLIEVAKAIRDKRELELLAQGNDVKNVVKNKISLEKYFDLQRMKRKNPIKGSFVSTLAHLRRYKKGRIPINTVDEKWIEGFEEYLKTKVNEYTTLTYMQNLKALLNSAVRDKLITVNPFVYYRKMRKPDVEKIYLTIEEVDLLAKTESDRPEIKRAFLFSCFTGLRLSDVINLKWGNVKGDKIDFRQKKTSGFEYLPISETARKLIFGNGENVYGLPDENVFQVPSQQAVTRALRRWRKKAGLNKKITFHTARHTFATMALTQGVDLYTVSKLLGHADIKNTQIYAKIVDDKKRQAVEMLPKLDIA